MDAEHDPPTDTTILGLAVDGLNQPGQTAEFSDQEGSAMTVFDLDQYALFIGLDVGKSEHHATALTSNADKVYDKTLPNSEPKLQHLLTKLVTKYGPALLVVDQPATIGALPVAVAQSLDDVEVAYLPGLTMRRVADLHAGSARNPMPGMPTLSPKPRTMPATLRAIAASDEQIPELAVLAGFDDDLLAQTTATRNRLRGLLTQIHPGLERVIGPKLEHYRGVLDALTRVANPTGVEDGWAGPCAQPDCQTQPATGDQADRGHLRGDGRPDGGGAGHQCSCHRCAHAGHPTG